MGFKCAHFQCYISHTCRCHIKLFDPVSGPSPIDAVSCTAIRWSAASLYAAFWFRISFVAALGTLWHPKGQQTGQNGKTNYDIEKLRLQCRALNQGPAIPPITDTQDSHIPWTQPGLFYGRDPGLPEMTDHQL